MHDMANTATATHASPSAWSKSLKKFLLLDDSYRKERKHHSITLLHAQPRFDASQIQDGGNVISEYNWAV